MKQKNGKKEQASERKIYTVWVSPDTHPNSIVLLESNGKRYIKWKEGKEIREYQVSPIFAFRCNRREVQRVLDEKTGIRTGTQIKKIKQQKRNKLPVATGEQIPFGLSRNEFSKYLGKTRQESQQEWNEYMERTVERINNGENTPQQQENEQESIQELKEVISNLSVTLQALIEQL